MNKKKINQIVQNKISVSRLILEWRRETLFKYENNESTILKRIKKNRVHLKANFIDLRFLWLTSVTRSGSTSCELLTMSLSVCGA